MDFAGVSVRYGLGEPNSKFGVGDFYQVAENCDSAELSYPKYGINSSAALRHFQGFSDAEISRNFGNNLTKDDDSDGNEGLDNTQGIMDVTHKRPDVNSKLRPDVINNTHHDVAKFADDILKIKNAADEKLIEETNYIVKLEKMSPDTGVKESVRSGNHSEKKKSGEWIINCI